MRSSLKYLLTATFCKAMQLYTRKYHAQGIPIVPMLDILTILLIFFIVHTEFKHQVNVLKIDLPQTEYLAGEAGDRNSVLLEVGEDGSLALAGKLISPGHMADAVRTLLTANPKIRIQVAAAGGASMERFIEVMDVLAAQGLLLEEVPVRIENAPQGEVR